jgi:hypothetical protein
MSAGVITDAERALTVGLEYKFLPEGSGKTGFPVISDGNFGICYKLM